MKKLKAVSHLKLIPVASLCVILLSSLSLGRPSWPNNSVPVEPIEETQLNEARRLNEEAQAEFYRVQTAKLKETPAPSPPVFQFSKELSTLPLFVGLILVSVVAISSFFFTYRATRRGQMDAQFYEALKRLGDQDNALVRSSAAITLAQVGKMKESSLQLSLPYFKPALDNLTNGLLLEDNLVISSTIADSINQLVPYAPNLVFDKLYRVNLQLQDEMVELLAEFFVAMGAKSFEDFVETGWHQASSVTSYDIKVLQDLVVHSPLDYSLLIQKASQRFDLMNREEQRKNLMAALQDLQITAKRLRMNVDVCSRAFKYSPRIQLPLEYRFIPNDWKPRAYRRIFLVEADLKYAKLKWVNLTDAKLQYANLSNAQLRGAKLLGANLQGANLSNAILQGADLTGARLHKAILTGAKLKKANMLDAFVEDGSLSEAVM
jgi:hypothetical protein